MHVVQAPPERPLAATMRRARDCAYGGDCEFGALVDQLPQGGEWTAARELLDGGPQLERLLGLVCEQAGTERLDIAASWLMGSYAWVLAGRAVAALLLDARIPDLAAENVMVRFLAGQYWASDVAFLNGRCLALPDDPHVDHATVSPVAGVDELLHAIRDGLREHLAPLVDVLNRMTRRPRSALWRSAADELAFAFLFAGEGVGCRERAWELGERCLALGAPFDVPAGFQVLEHAGRVEITRVRRSCCLAWRTGDGSACFTCPRTSDAERCARMEAAAASEAA